MNITYFLYTLWEKEKHCLKFDLNLTFDLAAKSPEVVKIDVVNV